MNSEQITKLEKLFIQFCDVQEAAAMFDMTESELEQAYLSATGKPLDDFIFKCYAKGRAALRNAVFVNAKEGGPVLIALAKEQLGLGKSNSRKSASITPLDVVRSKRAARESAAKNKAGTG